MKRALGGVLLGVLLLLVSFSMVGCGSRVGLGIDTFASIPAPASVSSPDQADVILFALVVKLVTPAVDAVKKAHDAHEISDGRFVELMTYAQTVGHYSSLALDGIEKWRASGDKKDFDFAYPYALAAAEKFLASPEVKK